MFLTYWSKTYKVTLYDLITYIRKFLTIKLIACNRIIKCNLKVKLYDPVTYKLAVPEVPNYEVTYFC